VSKAIFLSKKMVKVCLAEGDSYMYCSLLSFEAWSSSCKVVFERRSRECLLKRHQSTIITGEKTGGGQRKQKLHITTDEHGSKYFSESFQIV